MTEDNCKHFFVLGEKKEFASSLGTHYSHCQYCHKNLQQHVVDIIDESYKIVPGFSKLSKQEKEKRTHIHVWDPWDKYPNTYRCVSTVTDWKTKYRVPCNQILKFP